MALYKLRIIIIIIIINLVLLFAVSHLPSDPQVSWAPGLPPILIKLTMRTVL